MRVLVIEDHVRMNALLKRGLQEEGYSVDVAATGEDGLWLARENPYDAVVLDVMLPDLDGFEVCRALRDEGEWAPILMLTARDGIEDRVKGLDAGADDYLTKPFSFAELSARLRALVRRGAHPRPSILEVAGLSLDPAAHTASVGGSAVALSPKEFSLLEFLMRHSGQAVSRTAIIDHVWDFAYDGASNIVDVYVGYLREKIDRPFGRETLETVRGVGYRLKPENSNASAD